MYDTWALVPFYHPPDDSEYVSKINDLFVTVQKLKKIVSRVIVVDDGARISNHDVFADDLISLSVNKGKAYAVRTGLRSVLRSDEWDLVVQFEADLDQHPEDAKLLIERCEELRTKYGSSHPTLVIGDRYPPHMPGLLTPYRQAILRLMEGIASHHGIYARDLVSGSRAYNRAFAEKFLERSKSDRYGLELEQVTIGYLENAAIETVMLTYSRPRESFTLAPKILENIDAVLVHRKAIEAKGRLQRVLVGILADMREKMVASEEVELNVSIPELALSGLKFRTWKELFLRKA